MPLPQKPQADRTLVLASGYPDRIPSLPEDVLKRFGTLSSWHENLNRWWLDSRTSLLRDIDEIVDKINEEKRESDSYEAATTLLIDGINTSLAALASRVSVLEAGTGGTDALSAEIDEVAGDLAAHIADKSTHGVVGDIVGTTDAQPLDAKTIGLLSPGHARFRSCVVSNVIYGGEIVTVPADYNWVVAGAFTVVGTLIIDGTMAFL